MALIAVQFGIIRETFYLHSDDEHRRLKSNKWLSLLNAVLLYKPLLLQCFGYLLLNFSTWTGGMFAYCRHLTCISPPAFSVNTRVSYWICQHGTRNQWKKTWYIAKDLSLKFMELVLKRREWYFQEITLIQNVSPFSSNFPSALVYLFVLFRIAFHHLLFLASGLCSSS